VIERRRAQRSFGDGLIAEEVEDLHETWMKYADQSLPRRRPGCWRIRKSWRRSMRPWPSGVRKAAPAAGRAPRPRWCCVCWCSSPLRNWSYGVLEREVRANLVYRDFTRLAEVAAARLDLTGG
jgi:IS5 family transposase